ncbi:hypothetical protein RQN30_08170 [Arcanobacterium hippocoleae]
MVKPDSRGENQNASRKDNPVILQTMESPREEKDPRSAGIQVAAGEKEESAEKATAIRGLTSDEISQRIAAGKINKLPPRTGKTVGDIIRANVFTRINAILGVLFVLVITTGSWINSAFGLLIFVNSAIGIVQELRARATLESLSLIGEEHPTVIREGKKSKSPKKNSS